MKRSFLLFCMIFLSCALPTSTPTPGPTPVPSPTSIPTATPRPPDPLGSDNNPFVLAIGPDAHPTDEFIQAGRDLAAQLEKTIGYRIVSVAFVSELDMVEAFEKGNAHIAALSPFGYLLAREKKSARAEFASARSGEIFYGAQFIALAKDEYESFYDAARGENIADAKEALKQFNDKKPCWSDAQSPSGYVIPLGALNQAGVQARSGAFVEGQVTVVRAVYDGGICDFGATYIDARDHPSLESNYPDVMKRVEVIWQLPKIIPYGVIVFSPKVAPDVERSLLRVFVDLMLTSEGKTTVQAVFGVDEIQIVQDAVFDKFGEYAKGSGLRLDELVK